MGEFDQAAYVAAYQKKNIREYRIKINRLTEPELLEHLDAQPNIQGYVKELIRRDMQTK